MSDAQSIAKRSAARWSLIHSALRPQIVILNLVLLTLAGSLFGLLRFKISELHTRQRAVLSWSLTTRSIPCRLSSDPIAPPLSATDYREAIQNTLFAKDRNPNEVIEIRTVSPPPPPPPMPHLPIYYGTMFVGDPVVMLRLPQGTQKAYHSGDEVGPFRLVNFDREKIVFDWHGEIVKCSLAELKETSPLIGKEVSADPVPSQGAARLPATAAIASESYTSGISNMLGRDTKVGIRLCVAAEGSPAGTVVGGYRKTIINGTLGPQCLWELVSP